MSADLAIVSPRNPANDGRHLHPAALPRWRALLEAQWRDRLELITRFSLAYHDAEAAAGDPRHAPGLRIAARHHADWLLRRAVAERYALAETEAALARVATGRFGWCEACGAAMSTSRLTQAPQARYCTACSDYSASSSQRSSSLAFSASISRSSSPSLIRLA